MSFWWGVLGIPLSVLIPDIDQIDICLSTAIAAVQCCDPGGIITLLIGGRTAGREVTLPRFH